MRREIEDIHERGKHKMSGEQGVMPISAGTRQSVYISRDIPTSCWKVIKPKKKEYPKDQIT
jgi:hypothetical protein